MEFVALFSAGDTITKGEKYHGQFIYTPNGIRIIVWDNKKRWQTYAVRAFAPAAAL